MGLHQSQVQKQQHKILPAQIQLQRIFQMNDAELDQMIAEQLADNPMLEQETEDNIAQEKCKQEETLDFRNENEYAEDDLSQAIDPQYAAHYSKGDSFFSVQEHKDFRDELKKQYRQEFKSENEYPIADYFIDSLNHYGMFDNSMENICDDLSFQLSTWIEKDLVALILERIQGLEPPGIGARNHRECFLLKLRRCDQHKASVQQATQLIRDLYPELCSGNLDLITKKLNIGKGALAEVLQLLASLGTRPFVETGELRETTQYIHPDFLIHIKEDILVITLTRQRSDYLFINSSWQDSIDVKTWTKNHSSAREVQNKRAAAQWLINAIKERETNMLKIMKCIIGIQSDYFQEGDILLLKPMTLKDVAQKTNLDISTVSRVISERYAETFFGIIKIKQLFSEGLALTQGSSVISNKAVLQLILQLIEKEDKSNPLQDKQLVKILVASGIKIARRTVTKYREKLKIPTSFIRKGKLAS
jgi:RNA polymerase sigma-54 factor